MKSPTTNGQAKASSISSESDAENSSGHLSMTEKRPSKPPRRQHSSESANCEQQTDNLVEEIYLSPESGPLVNGQTPLATSNLKKQQTR